MTAENASGLPRMFSSSRAPPYGFLNIDKPSGLTSRDVVDRVVRVAGTKKCGHAGTLDPLAEGVLVVALGPATRLIEYVQQMRKRYRGDFLLGRQSPTDDIQGEVTETPVDQIPSEADVRAVAARFVGQIMQRPPNYAAVKVRGRRAYDLARKGHAVELAPRPIMIYGIDVVRYAWPELRLDVECGSGAYIRALARDIAEQLGTKAVMSALVRESIGEFQCQDAVPLATLTRELLSERMLPASAAVPDLPRWTIDESQHAALRNGRLVQPPAEWVAAAEIAAMDQQGQLVAILEPRHGEQFGPRLNLA